MFLGQEQLHPTLQRTLLAASLRSGARARAKFQRCHLQQDVAALPSNLYQVRNTFIHIEAWLRDTPVCGTPSSQKGLRSARERTHAMGRSRAWQISATSSPCLTACNPAAKLVGQLHFSGFARRSFFGRFRQRLQEEAMQHATDRAAGPSGPANAMNKCT